ncbi:MAG: hypothetical protein V3R53_02040 [Gammaproteobacteria bacterium]
MASRRFGRSLLAQHIDAVLEGRRAFLPPVDCARGKTAVGSPVSKPILCAGLAFLVLDPGIASAVSLGELSIDSVLNQPLSASVPVRVNRGEVLTGDCVTIPEQAGDELSKLRNPELRIPSTERPGTYSIRITTRKPLFEPMYEFAIRVNCLGTPLLLKHYVLMLDLPGLPAPLSQQTMRGSSDTIGPAVSESAVQAQQPKRRSAPADRRDSPRASAPADPRDSFRASAPADRRNSTRTPVPASSRSQVLPELIEPGADYRVSGGDTLSSIASRVKGRPSGSVWDVADWIYAANPYPFVSADPDVIKRGAMLRIPAPGYWETGPVTATVSEPTITAEPETAAAPLPILGNAIEPGTFYRVSSGDCLSNIAERVAGRPSGSVWDVADWIYRANRNAFVDANPDLIQLGSMLRIPAPGYWDTGAILAADRRSAAASTAARAGVRAETPVDETGAVEMTAPASAQAITAREIDYGVSESSPVDADRSLADLAAAPFPQPTQETEFIDDFALSVDPSPADEESIFAEQGNKPVLAGRDDAANDITAFDSTADEIAALRRQLAEARELAEAAQQAALRSQALAATQSAPTSSPEASISGINPLLAIPLGLLVGLALSSLLLRNRLTELFKRLRGDSSAASEETLPNLENQAAYVDTIRLGEPPAAYESTPADVAESYEASTVSMAPPIPTPKLEFAEPASAPKVSLDPTAPSQHTAGDAPADSWTPDPPGQSGITDPDPTGTMSDLFGLEVEHPEPGATAETADEMDITRELTAKGLALPEAIAETPDLMDITHELTAKDLVLPDATAETPDLMDITHELTAKGLALPDAPAETPELMDITSTHTVQELSELVDPEEEDDLLSATLSEALGLLEQDYEDEFESSQIIDPPKLDPSFLDEDAPTIDELTEEKEDS